MSDDIYGKSGDGDWKLRSLARRCQLDAEDEAKALSVYHGMVEAVADCIAGREHRAASAPPATVYIAAYHHRFGFDLSAHATHADAESRLLSIAWQQCMRDADIRAAVDARFGPLLADRPPLEPPFVADEHEPFARSRTRFEAEIQIDEADAWPCDGDSIDAGSGRSESMRIEDGPRWHEHSRSTDREARRRTFCEQLLDEWPQLAGGEQLWVVSCEVEREQSVDAEGDSFAGGFAEGFDEALAEDRGDGRCEAQDSVIDLRPPASTDAGGDDIHRAVTMDDAVEQQRCASRVGGT